MEYEIDETTRQKTFETFFLPYIEDRRNSTYRIVQTGETGVVNPHFQRQFTYEDVPIKYIVRMLELKEQANKDAEWYTSHPDFDPENKTPLDTEFLAKFLDLNRLQHDILQDWADEIKGKYFDSEQNKIKKKKPTSKWLKEETKFYDSLVWIYLTHPGFNSKGEQTNIMCIEHTFHDYDEIVKVAEILNDIIKNPSKLHPKFKK